MAPELAPRVRVNPFGIDLPLPLDPAGEQQGGILFVGNYTHPPNVDAALWLGNEIMPLLRRLCPGARLTLVGPYPPDAVQALACRDITVTGRVPEIEPYFEKASVILAPVRIGGGMRMKVLQAMALGKPVVTTSRGADGLVVDGQKPPAVVADEAEEIARATAELLACDDYRLKTGCCARAFVAEHFSAQAYARRIEAIYAGIIQERTVRS
jgi:glycosyltransferase involved in cell wall biosynthesis